MTATSLQTTIIIVVNLFLHQILLQMTEITNWRRKKRKVQLNMFLELSLKNAQPEVDYELDPT